ncbi:MAG: hypothetical protein IJ246_12805 [Clostridia bacterium]|nr:hypothetical protein [Clostridia bacterium]
MSERKNDTRLHAVSSFMKRWVTHNIGYKIFSVLLAVFVWAYVISQDPTLTRDKTMSGATVTISGADTIKRNGYIVTSSLENQLQDVTVRAAVPQTQYQNASASNYNLRIDLSRIRSAGEQEARILWTNSTNYGSVVEVTPASVTVNVEEYITRYRIPVMLEMTGKLADGWYTTAATLDPPMIAVSGPLSLVQSIVRARASLDLSLLSGEEGTVLTAVPFTLLNSQGEEVESSLLEVTSESVLLDSVIVEQTLYPEKELSFSDIGLVTGTPAYGYEIKKVTISPEQVIAAGHADALQEFEQVFTDARIDVTDLNESFTQILRLRRPSSLVYLSEETVTVAVEIGEKIGTRTFNDVRLNMINTPANYNASLSSRYANVTLEGPVNWLDSLRSARITLSVNLAGLEEGEHEIPILCEVSDSDGVDYDVQIDPANVTVTLKHK